MRTASASLSNMADDPNDARLLFCPFCRECYEGESTCPVHELELVDFIDLPKQAHERQLPGWEEDLLPWDPRFGRAWLALGTLVVTVGWFLPFASATVDDRATTWSALELALGPARSLWTVPFTAALFAVLLLRRRTPLQMLGARLVGLLLSFMPALTVGLAMLNMRRGIDRMHGGGLLEWGVGPWVMALGSVLLLIGSARFGTMPAGGLPHGSEPEGEQAIDVDES